MPTTITTDRTLRAVAPNPKRLGTEARELYDEYRPGLTVAQVLASSQFPRRRVLAALRWDLARGYVTLV